MKAGAGWAYRAKTAVRLAEARWTPRTRAIRVQGACVRVVRSAWWDDSTQQAFDGEILPYFSCLRPATEPCTVLDAGAALGLFSIAGVRWACLGAILVSMVLTSRIRNALA